MQYLPALIFNLFPLFLIAIGRGSPFEIMAFYWVEIIAIGIFAIIKMLTISIYEVQQKTDVIRARPIRSVFITLAAIGSMTFFTVHYGFFIVLMCFMIGGFLPEGTATEKLTDPFVPFRMVASHVNFYITLPVALFWQGFEFIRSFILKQAYTKANDQSPILGAYGHLMTLFVSAFFGMILAGMLDDRIWGAIMLVAVKTSVAMGAIYLAGTKRPVTTEV